MGEEVVHAYTLDSNPLQLPDLGDTGGVIDWPRDFSSQTELTVTTSTGIVDASSRLHPVSDPRLPDQSPIFEFDLENYFPTPANVIRTTATNIADDTPQLSLTSDPHPDQIDAAQATDRRDSHDKFVDCSSIISKSTYFTAWSSRESTTRKFTDYTGLLRDRGLLPVDPMLEQNWSGRGQHAEFEPGESPLINQILEPHIILGSSNTAVIQSVRCRRILLARKTIRCNRHFTKAQAIGEVAHLKELNHSHIVRVIGTYSQGNSLSILLYPVAEYDLQCFLSEISKKEFFDEDPQVASLVTFFGCLSDAVYYIHGHIIKHMDIKPKNILVRPKQPGTVGASFKVYIADFGIARSYCDPEDAETDGPTLFTRRAFNIYTPLKRKKVAPNGPILSSCHHSIQRTRTIPDKVLTTNASPV
ncbi:kinase-like protein [Amniculicola lignicola CBS 123094]|uniref:Kinase-like protein n=1 Tax=Amniculicola lignicola CBS 123094 TaxID=1392246 RepID=A0A6A5W9Z2_9PLEO|nr:kinase-like protein [Amniculicola lignicola CBS 123094]